MRARLSAVVAVLGIAACGAADARPVAVSTVATTTTTAALRGDAIRYVPRPVPPTRASRGGERSSGPRAETSPSVVDARPGGSLTSPVSWYDRGCCTASGERFNPDGLTFAHRTMAFGSRVRFCHDGRCVVARCNDRGPAAWTGRDFDLSRGAFRSIAPLGAGVVTVTWVTA